MSTLQTIFQKKLGANNLRRGMNLWPPLLFAGVRILHIAPDFKRVTVQMKLRWFNRNYVGTHFGGSLYAMTDPFYMLMLMKNLGRRYYVWDYSADIRFLKPADSAVTVEFCLEDKVINHVVEQTASGEKHVQYFNIQVILQQTGDVVATVRKGVYVRLKPQFREKTAN